MSKEKEVKNPNMYGYAHGVNAPVKGGVLNEMMRLVPQMLEKETNVQFKCITAWHTAEGEAFEGTPTPEQIEKQKLTQSINLDKTLNNDDPDVSYTSTGLDLLRLQVLLHELKSQHIDEGVAKTAKELQAESKMEVIK